MNKLSYLFIVCIVMLSCNEKPSQSNDNAQGRDGSESHILEPACYAYHADGNNINLEITDMDGSNVSGNLDIAYAEKDANSGTFTGKIDDDHLIATYTFNSEGTESQREIAFLVKKDQLIEGYGPLNEEGTAFIDYESIKYTSNMPLTKTACD